MRILHDTLHDSHPFTHVYRHAFQLAQNSSIPHYHIQLYLDQYMDQRRYNLPSNTHEVAAILPANSELSTGSQDIIIHNIGGNFRRITECNHAYLPLHFPLLFPTGQLGWTPQMKYANTSSQYRPNITFTDFMRYRLHPRPPNVESTLPFQACHLFQELIVNSY